MALSAGVGVLIGLGLGSGVTALLMKRTIRRQDNALQQSLGRLNRIQEEHTQELNAALAKMETDYEQQLAAKIELYQDTHQEHLSELQAEYEARIAVLTNVPLQEIEEAAPLPLPTDNLAAEADGSTGPTGSTDITGDGATDDATDDAADGATDNVTDGATGVAIGDAAGDADQPTAESTFVPIPDPWEDGSTSDAPAPQATVPVVAEATIPNPSAAPRPVPGQPDPAQTATELGKAAAINRKEAIRAVPQLGKLLKDNNADVRLAAVTALRDTGSIKAIPLLRQALRDSDSRIVAAASAALDRFKGVKKPAPKVKTTKKKRRR